MPTKPRPGGRTARTRTAVFEAAAALLEEKGHAAIAMTDIAARAGVAATSLYRRWGDVRTLLMEVAVERLVRDWPLPDTGSVRGDLTTWGGSVASSLIGPDGSPFFRAMVATAPPPGADGSARFSAIARRIEQIDTMLDRGRARGETVPSVADVLDHLLAPLYMRALVGAPVSEAFAETLVERLLA